MGRVIDSGKWVVGTEDYHSWAPHPHSPLFLSKADAVIWIALWMTFHPGTVPLGVRLTEREVDISEIGCQSETGSERQTR